MHFPLGYRYAATYAGIRNQQTDDIALIVSDVPANAAAVFTTNVVQAAPIRLAKKHLRSSGGRVAAVLINAGNANCATRTGEHVANLSCKAVAKALRTKPKRVLPASTGVIGVELNAKLLTDSIQHLVSRLSPDRFETVARAMMTTDTKIKVASEEIRLRGGTVRIAGMTKGSGMIHPRMATTLGFVVTDADIAPKRLHEMLVSAVGSTYHALTVDGDTSTNDMVLLLANGASKVKPRTEELELFQEALTSVLTSLAAQIAADGEGARKSIIVRAVGFNTAVDARRVAESVAKSLLVKTAIAGSDPNWGRILAAAGYSGVRFDPSRVDIYFQDVLVCRDGVAVPYDEADLKSKLDLGEVRIGVTLNGKGKGEARFFTCDLTEDYIRINGSYRT